VTTRVLKYDLSGAVLRADRPRIQPERFRILVSWDAGRPDEWWISHTTLDGEWYVSDGSARRVEEAQWIRQARRYVKDNPEIEALIDDAVRARETSYKVL